MRETQRKGETENSSQHPQFSYYYLRINQWEVRVALQKMWRNKAVGPNQIPIEAWRCLRYEGVKWLTFLFNKIFSSTKMPDEWRLSEVITVYKNSGCTQKSYIERNSKEILKSHKGYVRAEEAKTRLRTTVGNTEFFPVENGVIYEEEVDIRIGNQILQQKESSKYLGSVMHRSGKINDDVLRRLGSIFTLVYAADQKLKKAYVKSFSSAWLTIHADRLSISLTEV
ncbi:hypothetical protein Tco_1152841 [Tanacetum coccineum]